MTKRVIRALFSRANAAQHAGITLREMDDAIRFGLVDAQVSGTKRPTTSVFADSIEWIRNEPERFAGQLAEMRAAEKRTTRAIESAALGKIVEVPATLPETPVAHEFLDALGDIRDRLDMVMAALHVVRAEQEHARQETRTALRFATDAFHLVDHVAHGEGTMTRNARSLVTAGGNGHGPKSVDLEQTYDNIPGGMLANDERESA